MTPTLEQLAQRLERAEGQLTETKTQLDRAERDARTAKRRARVSGTLAAVAVGLTLLLNVRPAALALTPGVSLASLVARISALEQKTAPITVSGTPGTYPATLTIKGVNVQIVDGNPYGLTDDGTQGEVSGATLTGLGNLIIGYNETRPNYLTPAFYTGSHNLILGDQNSYSSYGGLVGGFLNTASAPYASITGGAGNFASGPAASVTGGSGNLASGEDASVTGGSGNVASEIQSVVTGGQDNTASGINSAVSGGVHNTANGLDSVVGGGNGASTGSGSYIWTAGTPGAQVTQYNGNFTSP